MQSRPRRPERKAPTNVDLDLLLVQGGGLMTLQNVIATGASEIVCEGS